MASYFGLLKDILLHVLQLFDVAAVVGGKWDIYLISVLAGCVVILILWRTRH